MNNNVKTMVMRLIDKNYTIATMESCTGGGLANEITNVPGASEIFKFGATTYSNEYKVKMGVSKKVIDKYSVYSEETAKEMSQKIAKFTKANFGVGITGKLKRFDPANGSGEDDVVFMSVYDRLNKKFYNEKIKVIKEEREDNKQIVLDAVAQLVLNILEKEDVKGKF